MSSFYLHAEDPAKKAKMLRKGQEVAVDAYGVVAEDGRRRVVERLVGENIEEQTQLFRFGRRDCIRLNMHRPFIGLKVLCVPK